jgi:hypothetical protein
MIQIFDELTNFRSMKERVNYVTAFQLHKQEEKVATVASIVFIHYSIAASSEVTTG